MGTDVQREDRYVNDSDVGSVVDLRNTFGCGAGEMVLTYL